MHQRLFKSPTLHGVCLDSQNKLDVYASFPRCMSRRAVDCRAKKALGGPPHTPDERVFAVFLSFMLERFVDCWDVVCRLSWYTRSGCLYCTA